MKLELLEMVFGVSSVIEEILWGIGILDINFWLIYSCDLFEVILILEIEVLCIEIFLILFVLRVIFKFVLFEGFILNCFFCVIEKLFFLVVKL